MKMTGIGKEILRKKIKEHCGRETYNKYSASSPARSTPPLPAHLANTRARSVDYSNWKQVLFKFEEIILPALEAESTRGIAEAKRAHLPLCLCACLPASSEVASAEDGRAAIRASACFQVFLVSFAAASSGIL